jgi:6-phosphogluconolactonase
MPPNFEHQQSSVLTPFSDSPATRDGGSDDVDHQQEQLLFVSSYSDFDKLAHGPRGRYAKHTLRTYRFHDDGSLVLLYVGGEGKNVINPAFSRFHPR